MNSTWKPPSLPCRTVTVDQEPFGKLAVALIPFCQRSAMTRDSMPSEKQLRMAMNLEKESTVSRLKDELRRERPKKIWCSLKCTEWTNIQNLNQKTENQRQALRRKRKRAKKMVKNALMVLEAAVEYDPETEFYWEWPTGAYQGWHLKEMKDFEEKMKNPWSEAALDADAWMHVRCPNHSRGIAE